MRNETKLPYVLEYKSTRVEVELKKIIDQKCQKLRKIILYGN